ncbi:unnamed protein product [Linum trigynum]|uniref:Uncharacterized protein n=1 Tax=Linum trigynum TaxID=586398 RepID=A0AAV2EET8_9ROSI
MRWPVHGREHLNAFVNSVLSKTASLSWVHCQWPHFTVLETVNSSGVSNFGFGPGRLDVHDLWSMFTVLGDRELRLFPRRLHFTITGQLSRSVDFSSVFALFDLQLSQNSTSTLPHVLGPETYQNKHNLA